MGWKKLIFGEKMPDKDDPKYEKRYKKEVEAGRKAARVRNALPASIRSGFSVSCSASYWDAWHLMCIAWYRYAYYRTMAGTPRPPNGRRFF